jgi:hypothetical protein
MSYGHPGRVEVGDFHPEAYPQVTAAELERHRVYVISGARVHATWNYEGTRHTLHPKTLDAIVVHHFHGPRLNLDVFLQACADGTFTDAVGTRIVVRRYTGADV